MKGGVLECYERIVKVKIIFRDHQKRKTGQLNNLNHKKGETR